MSNSIHGKRITPLHFMSRLDYLEQMVCELRDVLGRYAANGNDADIILKKYSTKWSDIYDKVDGDTDRFAKGK